VSSEASELFVSIGDALAPAYRLERSLGVGGMAVVFLAQDTKHGRPVAIKVLRREIAPAVGAARFEREIRVAARLTHPNILPLLDSGDVGGTPYYVMPYVEGESLRARLDRDGPLRLSEALYLTAEIADALNYAHAAGIVHRDIKPENILLLGAHAVVADFGIARAIRASVDDHTVTSAGIILGTPAYMSPEQAAGDDQLDGRSDVYSLGTLVFEMLTGTVPFSAKTTHQLIAKRFIETAPRVATRCAGVPQHVDAAVAAALALEPADRPQTAAAFARLLGDPADVPAAAASGASRAGTSTSRFTAAIGDPGMPSVAVLPFANLSSDPENEFLSDGITEEIMSALSRLRTLRVAARTSSFAFKGRQEDVRAIAEQLGVATVLDGSVRRMGSRVRVSAQLIDASTGFQLWSDQYDRQLDDVFQIQDDLARAIATALRATLLDVRVSAETPAVAGPAYEVYLRGRYALNKRTEAELHNAAGYFREATALDPGFALAFAGLGDALLMLGVYGAAPPAEVMPNARASAERALAIDPSLPEAHATLGSVRALFDWDWTGAEDAFRRAVALGPRYPTAFQWDALNHLLPRGRFTEARAKIERARSLDPLAMVVATSVGVVYHLSGDAAGAVRALKHAQELDPGFAMAHYFTGGALRDAGDLPGSAAAFRAAIGLSGGTPEMTAGLAQTLAWQGDVDGAHALQHELMESASRRNVSPCLLAQVHTALGDAEPALDALDRAADARDAELVFIGVRPAYAPLRGQARFDALRARVKV
jgi:serine/threonine-protein kinase